MWRLEPWDPEYRPPARAAEDVSLSGHMAVLGLEEPWQAQRPGLVEPGHWPTVYFVDGRQRIEARLWERDGASGLLATLVVGALIRDRRGLRLWETPQVERLLLHTGHKGDPISGYTSISLPDATPEELPSVLTAVLRKYEAALVERIEEGLVVADGQLTRAHRPGVLGYTKTQAARYLPPEALLLLGDLKPWERTPVFLLEGYPLGRPVDVYSWYVRLPLAPAFAPAAGLLRVETPVGPELDTALADLSVSLFCMAATTPDRDPRAPQSLYPIAGLEQLLGRCLGDARLAQRRFLAGLSQ